MDLDRLRQFLKIVELGSLTEAARAVHLTQPALSRSLQLLEEELRVQLFDRKGRGLVLTAAGRALVSRARTVLDASEHAAREVSRAAERSYFDLRLGTIDSVATFVLPNALEGVMKRFERLSVKLTTSRTQVLLARVRSAELDMAIVAHSGPPRDTDASIVARYQLQYFGRKDRFPALAKVSKESDLSGFPIVEIEPPPGGERSSPHGQLSHAVVSNVATVKALVLAGLGVGDLPDFMLSKDDEKLLVRAAVAHDSECALFVVSGPSWQGDVEAQIRTTLVAALRSALAARPVRARR